MWNLLQRSPKLSAKKSENTVTWLFYLLHTLEQAMCLRFDGFIFSFYFHIVSFMHNFSFTGFAGSWDFCRFKSFWDIVHSTLIKRKHIKDLQCSGLLLWPWQKNWVLRWLSDPWSIFCNMESRIYDELYHWLLVFSAYQIRRWFFFGACLFSFNRWLKINQFTS